MFHPAFIGHGSPMNALADNSFTRFLAKWGANCGKPDAVVVISAHWQTHGTWITGHSHPRQIFDFYGFPEDLYRIQYEPVGAPEIAKQLSEDTSDVHIDSDHGIDHAAWTLAKHMFPAMDIPLLELSLDVDKSEEEHFALGKELGKFSDRVLFLGSGNVVHNLREISFQEKAPALDWAIECDQWFKEKIEGNKIQELIQYKDHLEFFQRAIPTQEHFLPLLYILGMKSEQDEIATLFEEIQNGSISMRSFEIRKA